MGLRITTDPETDQLKVYAGDARVMGVRSVELIYEGQFPWYDIEITLAGGIGLEHEIDLVINHEPGPGELHHPKCSCQECMSKRITETTERIFGGTQVRVMEFEFTEGDCECEACTAMREGRGN